MSGLLNTERHHKPNCRVLWPFQTWWSGSVRGFAYLLASSVPSAPAHPQNASALVYKHQQQGLGSLMKTIQVNQVYQRPKASVIWENCWNSKVIFCNVILPIEHWAVLYVSDKSSVIFFKCGPDKQHGYPPASNHHSSVKCFDIKMTDLRPFAARR